MWLKLWTLPHPWTIPHESHRHQLLTGCVLLLIERPLVAEITFHFEERGPLWLLRSVYVRKGKKENHQLNGEQAKMHLW